MAENWASADPEGAPCWVEAQIPDVEAGKRFYGALFGWSFGATDHGGWWARLGGAPVAALTGKTDGRMPTAWTVYLRTPDAGALVGRVRDRGGRVVVPPRSVPGLGGSALVADPQGAVFGLWQPAGHPGFARGGEPGAFGWAELYTPDTEAADAFYGGLFPAALFGSGVDPCLGRVALSEVFPEEMPAHFLVHFEVADGEAALGAVTRLGGRVRVPPFETSYGGVAVVADDQGASFALLQR
ncbi:VOC family protein [Streptomyces sp. ZYX-F-203]